MFRDPVEFTTARVYQAPRTTREQIGSLGQEMLKQGDILLNLIFNEGLDRVDYKLTNNQTFNWHCEAPHSYDPPEKQDGSIMFVRKRK